MPSVDANDPTAARLAGASAALLRHALITTHGVDPDYADLIVAKHAERVPYLSDGRVHAEGLAALAARVAADVPDKFKADAAGDGAAGDVYAAIRSDVGRNMAAGRQRSGPSGAERLGRGRS